MGAETSTPVRPATLRESATRSRRWTAWSGSTDDLRRILRVIEDQYVIAIPAHVEEATASARAQVDATSRRIAELENQTGRRADPEWYAQALANGKRAHGRAQRELAEERADAEGAGRIKLTLTYSDDEKGYVTGTADQLADHVSHRRAKVLEFEAPSGRLGAGQIKFSAGRDSVFLDGARLSLSSPDARWVSAALAEISDEVQRGVPWWRGIRSWWFLLPFYFVCVIVSAGVLATPSNGVYTVPLAVMVGPFIAWAGAGVARQYIPPFELMRAGANSLGARVVTAIASGVVAIILGVFVNWIS